jgi:hypothetical protein
MTLWQLKSMIAIKNLVKKYEKKKKRKVSLPKHWENFQRNGKGGEVVGKGYTKVNMVQIQNGKYAKN